MVKHFLSQSAEEGLPWKIVDGPALERLQAYHWPGNVRELENVIRRLAALYSEETIGVDVIEAELAEVAPATNAELQGGSLSDSVENHVQAYFAAYGDALPPSGLYDRILKEVERPLIMLTLVATRGNQLKAADLLGLNRNTLRKKIRELNIQITRTSK